jgi:hypothetical protein
VTDAALLSRIEAQAVRIAELEAALAAARDALARVPEQLRDERERQLRGMAAGAANCGARYGCGLAARMLEDGP